MLLLTLVSENIFVNTVNCLIMTLFMQNFGEFADKRKMFLNFPIHKYPKQPPAGFAVIPAPLLSIDIYFFSLAS